MRYSQPFGTPQPPLGTYPRYINGNPVTGTEGSIPPATSFDEDQIEIVTVIQNAGLVPDHNDLTQLWQALELMIAKRYITTAITKTVHGAGADFADLHAAFNWLSNYTITKTGYVTFMVASGRYTYTSTVEISHPDVERVAIQGAALLGASPQGANMGVTGYHNASDGTNHVIYLRSIYATELAFTGGVSGFVIMRGGLTLRYLLLTGSQTRATPPAGPLAPGGGLPLFGYGSGVEVYEWLNIDGCSFWGWGNAGIYNVMGHITIVSTLNVAISYCDYGIYSQQGTIWMVCNQMILNSNKFEGWRTWAGANAGSSTKFYVQGNGPGNGAGAVVMESGGHVAMGIGSIITYNGQTGITIQGNGSFTIQSGTIAYNNGHGAVCLGPGYMTLNYSTVIGNATGYGAVVAGNGYVELMGVAMYDSLSAGSGGVFG